MQLPFALDDHAFAILLGGPVTPTPRLAAQIERRRVIAADSGIRHALALDVVPELWVGDFDSAEETDRVLYEAIPRAEFPAAKAKTDGALAVEAATDRGATDLLLVGAFGGARFDHAFAHVRMAQGIAEAGQAVTLTSGLEEGVILLPGRTLTPDWPAGTLFSVLPFEPLEGLAISGARWPLEGASVKPGDTLTLSNEAAAGLTIRIGTGAALVLAQVGERETQ